MFPGAASVLRANRITTAISATGTVLEGLLRLLPQKRAITEKFKNRFENY